MARKRRTLRVRQSREAILRATEAARRMTQDGASRESTIEALTNDLGDEQVALAIADFVLSESPVPHWKGNGERFFAWGAVLTCSLFGVIVYSGMRWMYQLVANSHQDSLGPIIAALGQFLFFLLLLRLVRVAVLFVADGLNQASYPTVHHTPTVTTHEKDMIRHRRLMGLLVEAGSRMRGGESLRALYREYVKIELTKPAAVWLLLHARVHSWVGTYLPPFTHRPTGYVIAMGLALGCWIGLSHLRPNLPSPAEFMYLTTWGVILTLATARAPKPVQASETL